MIKNRNLLLKLMVIILFYIGAFNATTTEQDITLNNPTSFPVDI
tara:strand:+ start:399 stop:530 length:132 start_codon:yes stop_codon:yes gene_type:complete